MALSSLREKFNQDKKVFGALVTVGDTISAETISTAGFDVVCFDMQHGDFDAAKTTGMIQAIRDNAVPYVRVLNNDEGCVGRALDSGALGIICPMINNKEQAQKLVESSYFPPWGSRSTGKLRIKLVQKYDMGGASEQTPVTQWANQNVLTLAMIETQEGLDNLEGILSVKRLSGIMIGPNDLAISLGKPPSSKPKGEVLKHIERILKTCKRKNKVAGIFCADGQTAKEMLDMGFDYVNVFIDMVSLARAAKRECNIAMGKVQETVVTPSAARNSIHHDV